MVEAYLLGASTKEAAAIFGLESRACAKALKERDILLRQRPLPPKSRFCDVLSIFRRGLMNQRRTSFTESFGTRMSRELVSVISAPLALHELPPRKTTVS